MVSIKNPQPSVEYNTFGTPVLLEQFISKHSEYLMNNTSGLQVSNGTTVIRTKEFSDWTAKVYRNFRIVIQIMKHEVKGNYYIQYTPVKMYSKKLKSLEDAVQYLETEFEKFKQSKA